MISILECGDGQVKVAAEYRDAELPAPGPVDGPRIIDAIRRTTSLEEDNGSTILALGIREESIDVKVKAERKEEGETVILKFPDEWGPPTAEPYPRGANRFGRNGVRP